MVQATPVWESKHVTAKEGDRGYQSKASETKQIKKKNLSSVLAVKSKGQKVLKSILKFSNVTEL